MSFVLYWYCGVPAAPRFRFPSRACFIFHTDDDRMEILPSSVRSNGSASRPLLYVIFGLHLRWVPFGLPSSLTPVITMSNVFSDAAVLQRSSSFPLNPGPQPFSSTYSSLSMKLSLLFFLQVPFYASHVGYESHPLPL